MSRNRRGKGENARADGGVYNIGGESGIGDLPGKLVILAPGVSDELFVLCHRADGA